MIGMNQQSSDVLFICDVPVLVTLQNYQRLSAMFAHFATTTGLTTPNDQVEGRRGATTGVLDPG